MSTASDSPTKTSAESPIVSTRLLDVPPATVFEAFRDPVVLAEWWGPHGVTNTFHEFDFRSGGAWRFVMHGPDGTDYPMVNDFVEIIPLERIHIYHRQSGHDFQLIITLAEESGKTRLIWAMQFDEAEEAQRVRDAVIVANEQNLDRLAAQLAKEPPKVD
jgi:uncharacterized protein YndB with AHSA1/START domain